MEKQHADRRGDAESPFPPSSPRSATRPQCGNQFLLFFYFPLPSSLNPAFTACGRKHSLSRRPPSLPPFQSFALSLARCRRGKVGQHPEGPFTHPSVLETARQFNVVSNFRRAVPRAATFQLTALWRRKEVKLSTHLSSWLHVA